MKKFKQTTFSIFLLTTGIFLSNTMLGQISNFNPPTDTVASINQLYSYDFAATGIPDAPTYSLDKALGDMDINTTTGLLTWTPVHEGEGGQVIVRATNTGFTETRTFYLYVAGDLQCISNTVAYWKLDETGVQTYDDSYGSHDASSPYQHLDSTGVVGQAAKFTRTVGTGIGVPDHADFHTASGESFSVSLWFKTPSQTYNNPPGIPPVMFGRDEGNGVRQWWIGFQDLAYSDIWFWVLDGAGEQKTVIKPANWDVNLWNHLVCLYDADNDVMRMYLNGSNTDLVNDDRTVSFTATNQFDNTIAADLSIGCMKSPAGYNYPFYGYLDEVLYFDKALSQAEIDDLYDKGIAGNPACDPGNIGHIFRTDPVTEAYEDNSYSYQCLADDVDGGTITYTATTVPSWATFSAGTRTLSGLPDNSDVGSDSVVIRATVGTLNVYQRFLLTVVNTNDAPSITSTEVTTVNEDEAYSYDADASDDDAGDNLTFSLQPPTPGWLSVNPTSGLITGTPPADDDGDYSVTVRVTDDSSAYDEQSYTLDILPINDAPEITGQSPLDVDEDNPLLIQLSDVTYTDVDNGPGDITLTVIDGANYSNVGNTITPDQDFDGALVVDIELSDLDSTASGQLDVTVNPINDAPEIISFPEDTAWEGQTYDYVFNADDVDNLPGDMIYTIPEKPDWLTWVAGIRTLSGTPGFGDISPPTDTLTINVSDGTDDADTTIIITVMSSNDIPHITSAPVTAVNEDDMYLYNIIFEDADIGDIVTLTCPVKPDWLTFDQGEQLLTGLPTNDQVGTEASVDYPVQLRVFDGKQDSTQTFNITVTNINDAPEILGQVDTTGEFIGNPLLIELSHLDVEDVDNNVPGDLTLTVLPGTGYSQIGNEITISAGVTEKLVEVNVRVEDLEPLQDEGILYVKVLDFVGIKDLIESNSLVDKIYPVPASEFIRFSLNPTSDFTIEIIDITGKTIFEEQYSKGDRLVEINTSGIPSGLYIFEVKSNSEYQVGRLTISNR